MQSGAVITARFADQTNTWSATRARRDGLLPEISRQARRSRYRGSLDRAWAAGSVWNRDCPLRAAYDEAGEIAPFAVSSK